MSTLAPSPKLYIFDACALLAFLDQEPGAIVIDALLSNDENLCLVHAINLCEVYYDIVRRGSVQLAREAVVDLRTAGIQVRNDMDEFFWQQVGELKVTPGKLSLADCFALALAMRTGATLVTSDHHEFDRIDTLKLCTILFIR